MEKTTTTIYENKGSVVQADTISGNVNITSVT